MDIFRKHRNSSLIEGFWDRGIWIARWSLELCELKNFVRGRISLENTKFIKFDRKIFRIEDVNCNMVFSPWRSSIKLYKILLVFRNNLFILKFSCPQIPKVHQWTWTNRRREPLIAFAIYCYFRKKALF
jgi:hypothetical protein